MTDVVFVDGTWCGRPREIFGNDGDEYNARSHAEEFCAIPLNGDWLDSCFLLYKNLTKQEKKRSNKQNSLQYQYC